MTVCSLVDMNKQKQEELSKESKEMTRLMEEMRLNDEEKKRWYVKKHSLASLRSTQNNRDFDDPELISVSPKLCN